MKQGLYIFSVTLILCAFLFSYGRMTSIGDYEYIQTKVPDLIDHEITHSLPNVQGKIYLLRTKEGIIVTVLKRTFFGLKMTKVDEIKFKDGPAWHYVEIKLDEDHIVPLVYGFINDDPQNLTTIKLKNEKDNFDQCPISNVSFQSKQRGWYWFFESPPLAPEKFVLYKFETGESLYK